MATLRDEHRLREKIDLSLDERQIPALGVAVLLLFGAVFAVGVFIGKGLVSSQPVQRPSGNLEALDARRDAPVRPPGQPLQPVVAPGQPQQPAQAPLSPAQARTEPPPRSNDRPAAAAPAADAARPAPNKPLDQRALDQAAREKAQHEKVAAEAREARSRSDRLRAEARERALAAAREKVSGEAPPPAAADGFTVQLGSVQSREEADRIVAKARAAGLAAFVEEANLVDKGVWYRVRVGPFTDRAEAERVRAQAQAAVGGRPVVMPTR